MGNVVAHDRWKKNATGAERACEVGHLAAECPAQFEKVVVIWQGRMRNGEFKQHVAHGGCESDLEALGLIAHAMKGF